MNFKLFCWHVTIERTYKRPKWWTRSLRMRYARMVEDLVGEAAYSSSRRIPRIKAIRNITIELWGDEHLNLREAKEWVEATFENCGRGELILL